MVANPEDGIDRIQGADPHLAPAEKQHLFRLGSPLGASPSRGSRSLSKVQFESRNHLQYISQLGITELWNECRAVDHYKSKQRTIGNVSFQLSMMYWSPFEGLEQNVHVHACRPSLGGHGGCQASDGDLGQFRGLGALWRQLPSQSWSLKWR